MAETVRSGIWHLGEWGPSVVPAAWLLPEARHTAGLWAQSREDEERGKITQGNYLRDFVLCTNLALKRAQLSLHLSTSASNYVKKNIIVLLTLILAVSARDR